MKYIDNKPEYIVLYATTDCNHKCSHCFLGHSMNWDPDELEKIAEYFSLKCLVHINGAEPLLNLRYLKAYKAAKQKFIFSNGLVFLKDDVEKTLFALRENGITEVRLSNHFQASSTLNSVKPNLVESVAKLLISNGFEVHYNSTVTSENYRNIEENCELAYKIGVKRIKFFPLKSIGRASNMTDLGLTFDEMKVFYKKLQEVRKHYDISDFSIKVSGDLAGISDKFTCTYGNHSYAITPDKQIYGCVYSISNLPPIGKLLDDCTIMIDNGISHDCKKCLLV